jgi:hypothetical protein
MPVPDFPERLKEHEIPIESINLDPNNPRLADLTTEVTPEERIAEDGVQAATLRRLNEGNFDMSGLRASIRRSGLLPLDRVVIRPLQGQEGAYVVVEGNRRIGAIRTLLQLHEAGDVSLDAAILPGLKTPRVLVLEEGDPHRARLDQWVIQGVRHFSGIRDWGGYQGAETIRSMVNDMGYSEREVADALTLSIQRVRRSLRVISALEQMNEDEEFGEYATPDVYAYLDEVIRRLTVRNWVGWDDQQRIFTDEDKARRLYSWISPDEELNGERRIPQSADVRLLDPVLTNESALAILDTPGQNLNAALRVAGPPLESEWRMPVRGAVSALRAIPTSALEELDEEDRQLIESLRDIAIHRLQLADTLQAQARADTHESDQDEGPGTEAEQGEAESSAE